MKYGGKLLDIAFFVMTIAYVLIGMHYSRTPRTFPLLVGIPMALLTGMQTLIDFFPGLSKKYSELGTLDAEMISAKGKAQKSTQDPAQYRKELEIFVWLAAAIGLILLAGILYGMPLFIFIFIKFRYAQGWKLSLGLPLGTLAVLYFVFQKILAIRLYTGLFF